MHYWHWNFNLTFQPCIKIKTTIVPSPSHTKSFHLSLISPLDYLRDSAFLTQILNLPVMKVLLPWPKGWCVGGTNSPSRHNHALNQDQCTYLHHVSTVFAFCIIHSNLLRTNDVRYNITSGQNIWELGLHIYFLAEIQCDGELKFFP